MRFPSVHAAWTDYRRWWIAAFVWCAGWLALFVLDGVVDLANQALVLVLVSTLTSLWTSPWTAMATTTVGVLAFNYAFVPPRGSLAIDLHQHALLILTTLVVSGVVALLMARQLRLAEQARRFARESDALRALSESLREIEEPQGLVEPFRLALRGATGGDIAVQLTAAGEGIDAGVGEHSVGVAAADEAAGLRICARRSVAMGQGTGRHDEQPAWYLPLRGRNYSLGAALVRLGSGVRPTDDLRRHAQALCDQMGLALERATAWRSATAAREAASIHALRNTMLAAIAHDHRTPLATILSAASSLHDQADRLGADQRRRLAATIVDEAGQLARLTDNTLQLARLDAPALALHLDWESAEEIVGTVMRGLHRRGQADRVQVRVDADLPVLRCDAVLLVQLLDNLVDNALKYSPDDAPVEIVARGDDGRIVVAVRDRGPGVPDVLRERIFEPFQRGESASDPGEGTRSRGAGIGLALCRAIARVHGGELRLRPREQGGASFELWLPPQLLPSPPPVTQAIGS